MRHLRAIASLAPALIITWAATGSVFGAGADRVAPAIDARVMRKLGTSLAGALAKRTADPLRVIYFVDAAPADVGGEMTAPARASGLARMKGEVRAASIDAERGIRATGNIVVASSDYAGAIVAVGNAASVAAAAALPGVTSAYLESTHRPRLGISKRVTQSKLVQARGINGAGTRIAIVDVGRIDDHPSFMPGRRLICRPGVPMEVNEHKTVTAGVILSADPVRTGVAPGTLLIDANAADFSEAELMAATDCAIDRGAIAINMSFGADTDGAFDAFAEYVDRVVYRTGVAIVTAVSNDCSLRMGSPEIAYNDISVGGFADRNTAFLGDDRHGCDPVVAVPFSAFRDPPSRNGDREQPDLLAPADGIETTFLEGFFGEASGTSLAAPQVTGGIALLEGRVRASLAGQAERIRATLMASARHNIEGSSRLSDRDGSGGVRFAAADAILRDGLSWWLAASGGAAGFPYTRSFSASAGQRVRVALVWAHKPGRGNATVSTDLDLWVRAPSGIVAGVSQSKDNNFELVEFRAPTSGTYSLAVLNRRPSPGREHMGIAVSRTVS